MRFERGGWSEPPAEITLGPTDVHVWRAGLVQPDNARHELVHILSADERKRMSGFRHERDRQRFAVAHGILRALLSAYVQIPPADLQLLSGAHGKPYLGDLHGGENARFSMAHSGDSALFAFARDREVGVDLEEIDGRSIDPFLAERFFAHGEQRSILARPRIERPLAMVRLWTLKEAYLKAVGVGLSQPLDSFEVCLDGDAPRVAARPEWSLTELAMGPQYVAALCAEGPELQVSCWDWSTSLRVPPRHWEAA